MPAKRKPVKPKPPQPLAEENAPPPARCPQCGSAKVARLGETASGLLPWRCSGCRRIGYGNRVIGEPVEAVRRAPLRRARDSSKPMSRFVRRPPKNVNPEDVP